MKYLLPTFIVIPILEMYVLIEVGSYIGAFNTLALVLLTAILGLALIRKQGFKALTSARIKLQESEVPLKEILTGFFLAIGGILLITPGFITDVFGFICLVPFCRKFLLKLFNLTLFKTTGFSSKNSGSNNEWIEGEYKREKEK